MIAHNPTLDTGAVELLRDDFSVLLAPYVNDDTSLAETSLLNGQFPRSFAVVVFLVFQDLVQLLQQAGGQENDVVLMQSREGFTHQIPPLVVALQHEGEYINVVSIAVQDSHAVVVGTTGRRRQ